MATSQDLAALWLRIDRDPITRGEIEALVANNDTAELDRRLRVRITFGTAGLRARMEAGFTRMNCVTVIQASQGLAAYLLTQQPNASSRGVVIGYDSRFNSEKFARLAAAAFVAKHIKVWWFGRYVHTPLVPFTVSSVGAAAGIMVTASHNPAQDNGYKVYWQNGCQIIPPHDKGIAAAIEENLEPVSWEEDLPSDMVENVFDRIESEYYERVKSLVNLPPNTSLPSFVYTPMHGVGLHFMTETMRRITASPPNSTLPFTTVPLQAQPDPTFPTVKFPNPEESGALTLSIATADSASISLIIATDPDADRLAVAEKLPGETGTWHQFTGNQVGFLLATHVLESYTPVTLRSQNIGMLASTVSSMMLRTMSNPPASSFHFAETLTGFKWLGNEAQRLSRERGWTIPFAYEEALGYMFTAVGHDKDGIAAAAVFLAAAAKWKSERGVTPYGRLQQLYEQYGYFADANTYLTSPSADVTDAVFAQIRALRQTSASSSQHTTDTPYPTHLGRYLILHWRDLTVGYDSSTPDHIPNLPIDPTSQMITCEVEDDVRFTVRGSGTEPKIKLYIEAKSRVSMEEARERARAVREAVVREWFDLKRWGLVEDGGLR